MCNMAVLNCLFLIRNIKIIRISDIYSKISQAQEINIKISGIDFFAFKQQEVNIMSSWEINTMVYQE